MYNDLQVIIDYLNEAVSYDDLMDHLGEQDGDRFLEALADHKSDWFLEQQ